MGLGLVGSWRFLPARFLLYTVIMVRSISVDKKKKGRGRPPKEGGAHLSIPARLPPDLVQKLDRYAADEGISRSEAVRHLIEAGLKKRR